MDNLYNNLKMIKTLNFFFLLLSMFERAQFQLTEPVSSIDYFLKLNLVKIYILI